MVDISFHITGVDISFHITGVDIEFLDISGKAFCKALDSIEQHRELWSPQVFGNLFFKSNKCRHFLEQHFSITVI